MGKLERQQRWRSKRAQSGFVRFDTWVPADRVDGLKALIADLIAFPEMQVVGFKDDREGVQGVQPPAVASPADMSSPGLFDDARAADLPGSADCRASDSNTHDGQEEFPASFGYSRGGRS